VHARLREFSAPVPAVTQSSLELLLAAHQAARADLTSGRIETVSLRGAGAARNTVYDMESLARLDLAIAKIRLAIKFDGVRLA
jgi:hypothetical protein